ncbi:PQQ-binding-like beta-propeller repeat protein [Actinoplanes sp. NPDC024001]|uniref:outer membrane protein assembly factor BamB family protein n=1 Tax=Actinoplanes sp. NPDC024001 TaxID=3154598 RepID=UPI0033FB6CE8
MKWRGWAALAGVGTVLVSGLGFLGREQTPAAGRPPAFVDPCAATRPAPARTVKKLPASVRLAGKPGRIISATMTESVLLLNTGVPLEQGPHPKWLIGLDPQTLATRWRWRFPELPGPVTIGMGEDPWATLAGDVVLTVSGIRFAGDQPVLRAVDLASGRVRWSERFPAGAQPVVVAADRCMVVVNAQAGNGTLGLWGLDPATGRVRWQNSPAEELLCTVPARPWLYGWSGGHLVRFSLADGSVTAVRSPTSDCGPVVLPGGQVVDSGTGRWYTIDWSRPALTPTDREPVRIEPDTYPQFTTVGDVLVVDDHGKAAVHDHDGTLLWQDDGTGRGYLVPAVGQPGDRLFFRTRSPFTEKKRTVSLTAVQARTGRTLWKSAAWPGNDEYPIVDPRTGTVLVHVTTTRQVNPEQFEVEASHLYALNGDDGHPLWDVEGDGFRVAGPWLLVERDGAVRGFRMS